MSAISLIQPNRGLFSWPQYQVACSGPAPFLPMSHGEVDQLGWDSCDIIPVTGGAYIDHPSLNVAVCGCMLGAQDFRVGIIAQLGWGNKDDFMRSGKPNLFFGVTASNMDSMINRYTTDRRLHHDDACTPDDVTGKRPDRAAPVYTQRRKGAWKDVPVILGGTEVSLCRTAYYDYWSDIVRYSVLMDSETNMLVLGDGKRPPVEMVHRLTMSETIDQIRDVRNTVIMAEEVLPGWSGVDSTRPDTPGKIDPIPHPYGEDLPCVDNKSITLKKQGARAVTVQPPRPKPWEKTYVLLPLSEKVKGDKVLYAYTSRILHYETNLGRACTLMQKHGDRYTWISPSVIPLSAEEMDSVFVLPYKRMLHPAYGDSRIPAHEMIRFSISVICDCSGDCSSCSITKHEGHIIRSHSEDLITNEIEAIRDTIPGFIGVISDLGGLVTDMYMLRCKSPRAEQVYHRLSCIYPDIYPHMDINHEPTISLYRRARDLEGIKRILIASGVRYDVAVEDPRYVKEPATHHVGGYLRIAPEHTEEGPLSKVMKPGMGGYDRSKELFDTYSKQAGKEQYLVPYFISTHPGTHDEDMVNLALWLKQRRFRLDQVQNFYPSPLANLAAMYYIGKNPLDRIGYKNGDVVVPKDDKWRRLHRALLCYHDPTNQPLIHQALGDMGKKHLIGGRRECLIPTPALEGIREARCQSRHTRPTLTERIPVAHQRQTPATNRKRGKVVGRQSALPGGETLIRPTNSMVLQVG